MFEKFGLDPELFYITYSGNIGLSQNLALLLAVAEAMQREINAVRFVIIGEGVEKEHLQSEIKQRNLSNVSVFPFQPYEQISHVFSLGDVGLIISKSGVGEISVPSKTWGIMAAERPILASFDKESDLVKIIEKSECGLTSKPDDVESMVDNIKTLYSNRELRMQMGSNAKRYLEKYNNKEKCVSMYVDTLKNVIKESK